MPIFKCYVCDLLIIPSDEQQEQWKLGEVMEFCHRSCVNTAHGVLDAVVQPMRLSGEVFDDCIGLTEEMIAGMKGKTEIEDKAIALCKKLRQDPMIVDTILTAAQQTEYVVTEYKQPVIVAKRALDILPMMEAYVPSASPFSESD